VPKQEHIAQKLRSGRSTKRQLPTIFTNGRFFAIKQKLQMEKRHAREHNKCKSCVFLFGPDFGTKQKNTRHRITNACYNAQLPPGYAPDLSSCAHSPIGDGSRQDLLKHHSTEISKPFWPQVYGHGWKLCPAPFCAGSIMPMGPKEHPGP